MRRAAVLILSLALSACGAETAATPAPAPSRAAVVTDIRLSGEYVSPTPAPSKTPVPLTPRPTLRSTVGPIFFQTPTPVATGAQDLRNVAADARFNPTQPAATAAAPGDAQVTIGQGPPVIPTAAPAAPPAPAPTATPITLTTGQSMPLDLPAGTTSCNTSETFKFNYPGDDSMVTVDAQFDGLTPANLGSAGINLWDSSSSTAPVQTATSLTNQKNSVPGSVELTYSRLLSGPVTVELYNWSQTPLTGNVTVVTLASNNSPLQLVGSKSPGAC